MLYRYRSDNSEIFAFRVSSPTDRPTTATVVAIVHDACAFISPPVIGAATRNRRRYDFPAKSTTTTTTAIDTRRHWPIEFAMQNTAHGVGFFDLFYR